MDRRLRVAVGRGEWHDEFAAALEAHVRGGAPLEYDVVDIDAHDWQVKVAPYDLIIWKGRFMGPEFAGHYKEKVYFIERVLDKVIVPGFATVWHYDSKVAQSYIFAHWDVSSPETVASFDYDDARERLDRASFPIVAKRSHGASSTAVRLVQDRRSAQKWLDRTFSQELWDRYKAAHPKLATRWTTAPWHRWFWAKVLQRLLHHPRYGVVYWQEYIPNNDADLRITVIGDSYAYGFWRRNRPGDFRASGSGLLDYETHIPEEAIRYCLSLNRQFGFDSMAYDLLIKDGVFVITEMSYAYVDSAVLGTPGHYVLGSDDHLMYEDGHVPPQALWVDWALTKFSRSTNGL
ncbi:MAG: hypothetical protein LLG45_06720 [Actinomycetia bacterium]|nr:hypothetical protein [Actinomycetes bacterium]